LKTHVKALQVVGLIGLTVLLAAQAREPKPVVVNETFQFSRSCPTGWDFAERTETTVTFRCTYDEENDPR
jgi:hypothetical protein